MTPLRIIPASEPIRVEQIILTIFASPGVGKTSTAFSAEAPLLLDTDKGAHRSAFRKDSVRPQTWEEIAGINAADVKPYKTLVLDTAGRALDLLATDIIANNAKMGRGGALTLQGYGQLKSDFYAYLTLMRSFGLDIVLISHSEEKQRGDDIIDRLDMQGASKQEVYKSSDAMASLRIINGERVLSFSPSETSFGKDPAGLGRIVVPDLATEPQFLAGLIARIKDTLNTVSAEQQAAAEMATQRASDWAKDVASCAEADDFTLLASGATSDSEKRALVDAAKGKGFEWSKKDKKFAAVAV